MEWESQQPATAILRYDSTAGRIVIQHVGSYPPQHSRRRVLSFQ
jgi:hypothetical protein